MSDVERVGVTRREREVLALLGERLTNAEISDRLCVSVRTTESHVSSLLTKLGASNRRALTALAVEIDEDRTHRTRLPAAVTSFIGREQEIASVRRELRMTRLLTVTGAGGSGKSRLALEVAAELQAAYRDGVTFVELAAVADPALLAQVVAVALDVSNGSRQSSRAALMDWLDGRRLLLVLDNCEHLIDGCAELTESLLRRCPHLDILATSREVLGVVGETVWQVPSLCPSLTSDVGHGTSHSDAIRLFIERAQRQRSDFEPTETEVGAIDGICRCLDGIPLAIELAAARLRVLSVEEIAARLDDRFRLLSGGGRARPGRHQTLRASMDWSYDLLTGAERALLRRLSVFPAGFGLDGVESVGRCADDDDQHTSSVIDLLAALVGKSLVVSEQHGGALRYRMHETVRQYAAEHLAAAGKADEEARDRHLDWCLDFAERVAPESRGPGQPAALDHLELEHDNVRAALGRCIDQGRTDVGLRLAQSMWWFWWVRGFFDEGRHWLTGLLTAGGDAGPTTRAAALNVSGWLSSAQGDHATAAAAFEESLDLHRQLDDALGVAKAVNGLGSIAWEKGQFSRAAEQWREALSLFREVDDSNGVAVALNNLGLVAREQGDYELATSLLSECRDAYRSLGDRQGEASALANLGQVHAEWDDDARAHALYSESLRLREQLGHRHGIAIVLARQGQLAVTQGDYEEADRLLMKSLDTAQAIGDHQRIAYALCSQGELAHLRGDVVGATDHHEQALAAFRTLGEPLGLATALTGLAAAVLSGGNADDAETCLQEALALYREMGHRKGLASSLHLRAEVARRRGEHERAVAVECEALAVLHRLGVRRAIASCLEGLATSAGATGQTERATRLRTHADRLRRAVGAPTPLPDDPSGEAMSVDDIVAEALGTGAGTERP